MTRPALFLDRDGVLNYNRADYVKTWDEFQFLPGVLAALPQLTRLGWPTVVVSNQSAVGRGLLSADTLEQIHQRMLEIIRCAGGVIDSILYCPHHPNDDCNCRKHKPGLLLQARDLLQIDLSRSILVGDAVSDIDAAQSVGCLPILVKSGRGLQQLSLLPRARQQEIIVAEDLADGIAKILVLQNRHLL